MILDLKYNEVDSWIYFFSEGNNLIIVCEILIQNCIDIYSGINN